MDKEEIIQLVSAILEPKLQEMKDELSSFRRWNPQDSVTDQFSPITGASQQIGFYGTTKKSKQTVTGSKGANAALTSLMAALSTIGLVTDSTS
jgi:hypothetical protein